MGKQKHPKVNGSLHISREAETYTIPKSWEKSAPIVREKYGKTRAFQNHGSLKYFRCGFKEKIEPS